MDPRRDRLGVAGEQVGCDPAGLCRAAQVLRRRWPLPRERDEVPAAVIEFLAGQVRVPAAAWLEYRWEGRTFEYHRAQVRGALGYREPAAADAEVLAAGCGRTGSPASATRTD